jgi:hypothetical protein
VSSSINMVKLARFAPSSRIPSPARLCVVTGLVGGWLLVGGSGALAQAPVAQVTGSPFKAGHDARERLDAGT